MTVPVAGDYRPTVSVAAPGNGSSLSLAVAGEGAGEPVAVPATGDGERWQEIELPSLSLRQRIRKLRVRAEAGGFNVCSIAFEPVPGAPCGSIFAHGR